MAFLSFDFKLKIAVIFSLNILRSTQWPYQSPKPILLIDNFNLVLTNNNNTYNSLRILATFLSFPMENVDTRWRPILTYILLKSLIHVWFLLNRLFLKYTISISLILFLDIYHVMIIRQSMWLVVVLQVRIYTLLCQGLPFFMKVEVLTF